MIRYVNFFSCQVARSPNTLAGQAAHKLGSASVQGLGNGKNNNIYIRLCFFTFIPMSRGHRSRGGTNKHFIHVGPLHMIRSFFFL